MISTFNNLPDFDSHELVVRFEDPESGLKGYTAIHTRSLGPAVGGTRVFSYASEDDAVKDVLRLSRAMSYKCAIAGVQFGGGKSVIIADPEKDKTPALLKSYARHINSLQGQFFTGEDVGLTEEDVQLMLNECPFFIGKSYLAGDPSPYAALSVFNTMQTASAYMFGTEDLKGKTVAIKGVGKVGSALARLLCEVGARVVVADINSKALENICKQLNNITVFNSEQIHALEVDIYAPCALGSELSKESIQDIKAKIICGAANNQLADSAVAGQLHDRGILYIPDFIANAGGLIDVVDELEQNGYSKERVNLRIGNLKQTLAQILALAKIENISPHYVAEHFAKERFMKVNIPTTV